VHSRNPFRDSFQSLGLGRETFFEDEGLSRASDSEMRDEDIDERTQVKDTASTNLNATFNSKKKLGL